MVTMDTIMYTSINLSRLKALIMTILITVMNTLMVTHITMVMNRTMNRTIFRLKPLITMFTRITTQRYKPVSIHRKPMTSLDCL